VTVGGGKTKIPTVRKCQGKKGLSPDFVAEAGASA